MNGGCMSLCGLSAETECIREGTETEAGDFAMSFHGERVVDADAGAADVPELGRPFTAPVLALDGRDQERRGAQKCVVEQGDDQIGWLLHTVLASSVEMRRSSSG